MDTVVIESKQFEQLLIALQKTSDVLALNLVRDCKQQNEKVVLLSEDFGYGPTDISRILNVSVNTVNVTLSRARKTKNNKPKKPIATEKGEVGTVNEREQEQKK